MRPFGRHLTGGLVPQGGLLRDPCGRKHCFHAAPLAQGGFTLLEIMIVMAIVGILITIAEPSYRVQTMKARETALQKDLFVMRDVIDQYAADQGRYPDSLQDLVSASYLRGLPVDPFTRSAETWIEVLEAEGDEPGGVFDVHSGSDLLALDGTAYNAW